MECCIYRHICKVRSVLLRQGKLTPRRHRASSGDSFDGWGLLTMNRGLNASKHHMLREVPTTGLTRPRMSVMPRLRNSELVSQVSCWPASVEPFQWNWSFPQTFALHLHSFYPDEQCSAISVTWALCSVGLGHMVLNYVLYALVY